VAPPRTWSSRPSGTVEVDFEGGRRGQAAGQPPRDHEVAVSRRKRRHLLDVGGITGVLVLPAAYSPTQRPLYVAVNPLGGRSSEWNLGGRLGWPRTRMVGSTRGCQHEPDDVQLLTEQHTPTRDTARRLHLGYLVAKLPN
jgi:hypothetical protein